MPHGARPPGAGKAGCESRPYQCTQDDTPRTLGVERQPEAFQRFTPDEAELPIREPGHPRGANPIADAILGGAVTRRAGTHKWCPPRAAVRQRPAAVAFASRETSQPRAYLGAAKARSVIERR